MAISKAVPVPKKEITSVDLATWASGLNLNGASSAPPSSFVSSKDVELSIDGFIIPRRVAIPFLPDTIGTVFQILPVKWNGLMYYFCADSGKLRFCKEGDATWTDCGGTNSLNTSNGGVTKFLRVLNNVLVLNGANGDKLMYIDLSTSGFPVVKWAAVTDPTTAMTDALTNLAAGSFNVYYAFSYSGAVGETNLSPILSVSVDHVRDQWQTMTTPGSVKVSRPAGAAPTGAKYWNLYVALAASGGTIQPSDMLLLAAKVDLNTHDFVDDGTLNIDLGQLAPTANSTDGPRVKNGIVEDGNPILFGDVDNPQAIWIGGGGPYAMSFSVSDGGYKAEPEKGTNFEPTVVIGFRNGQGIPSLTVLYSNAEGISKQSVLAQQTVNYGSNQSFSVWGVTSQHYGAAGVAATESAVNYNGKLLFMSTDGMMSMNTQPLRQNVIAVDPISIQSIDPYIRAVKNSAMNKVVGAGWDNRFMWTVPNDGFDTPQQILVLDDNNKVQDRSAWYALNIPAQWIGVVAPTGDPAFIFVCQGNKTYKLVQGSGTFDTKDGVAVPFSTGATGPMVGMEAAGLGAHNTWRAVVQVVFYFEGLVGDVTVGVNYRDLNGQPQTRQITENGPSFTPDSGGGWGDPGWTYGSSPSLSGEPAISNSVNNAGARDVRIALPVDDIMNEAQWFFYTPVGYSKYKLRAISFEGINLGVRPDLR